MSILVWTQRTDVEQAWQAPRSDGAVYQVFADPAEDPAMRWGAMVREPGKDMKIIGGARMRKIAQAICAQHCDESGVRASEDAIRDHDWPDHYRLEPFEPSGDPEWDRRAKGGVETDGL